uniref:Uncharacterized protein n=1 Tax=Triticum urartu TaxID=4572 RepID=A0A8R7QV83_TRIUA
LSLPPRGPDQPRPTNRSKRKEKRTPFYFPLSLFFLLERGARRNTHRSRAGAVRRAGREPAHRRAPAPPLGGWRRGEGGRGRGGGPRSPAGEAS